jgi:hypothetical protein
MELTMKNEELSKTLRRLAVRLGMAILIVSAYLSFDGFDGSVNGGNPAYSLLGYAIGFVFAVTVSTLQFIFSTNIKGLNQTLKFAGLFSYVYSIYTNKLGASHLLGMDETMAWITASFCDIVAEPMIAWGMGEALVGDLIGNFSKIIFGSREETPKSEPRQESRFQQSDALSRLPKKRTDETNSFFRK